MIWEPSAARDAAVGRPAVVAEARTWLGTPYAHRQRLRGAGVDCAGLPLEVYATVGIIPPTDVGEYSQQWHLHRSQEIYLDWVERFGREIELSQADAGDFMIWKFGRTFSHGGIMIDPKTVIHAYVRAQRVTIDDIAQNHVLANHPRRAYTFWGT